MEVHNADAEDFWEPAPKRRRISHEDETHEQSLSRNASEDDADVDESLPAIVEGRFTGHAGEEPEHMLPKRIHHPSAHDTPYSTDADPASSPVPQVQEAQELPTPVRQSPTLSFRLSFTLHGHTRAVAAIAYSPDGALLASASADATIKIWDATSGKPLHTLRGHLAGVSCLAWSPIPSSSFSAAGPITNPTTEYLLATGSDDKTIRLWRITRHTAKPHPTALLSHHNYILCLAFSPKGNILVSGSTDEAVILWSVRSCTPLRILPAHNDPVYGVDFSSDGTLVASCSSDGLIRIWDTGSGQCLRTFFHEEVGGGRPGCLGVMFSPNARYVAGWYMDSGVRLWDYVGEGAGGGARCVKTYEGAQISRYSVSGAWGTYVTSVDAPRNMDLAPTNAEMPGELIMHAVTNAEGEEKGREGVQRMREQKAFLASGSEDGDIVIWDVVSKEIMASLSCDAPENTGRNHTAFGVAVRAGGKEIASCGAERTLSVWRIEDDEELDEAGQPHHEEDPANDLDETARG